MNTLKKVVILLLKLGGLAFVAGMFLVQIPELLYDLSPKDPLIIESPGELAAKAPQGGRFVSIKGTADFTQAFVYKRYGLAYTYFTLRPYGHTVIVRTYEKVDKEWFKLERFLGKLRPFSHQPFHYRIEDIYMEKFGVEIPEGSYFLGMGDVPALSGWSIAAAIFAVTLWIVLFYFFFFWKKTSSFLKKEKDDS